MGLLQNSEGDEDADSVDNSISADLEFVQNAMYGDESDSASDSGIGPDSKPLMFEDFFEPRRSNRKGDQNDIVKRNKMEDRTQNSNGLHQSVDIHQKSKVFNRDKNYMWDTDGPLENSTENIMKEHKSALAEDISRLEANLLGDKPWEYKGEIKAAGRPENSLLEVSADVERYIFIYCYLHL